MYISLLYLHSRLWFNFILGFNLFHLSFKLIIIIICLGGLIVRVRVVPRRTVVGDIDQHFNNLSESHHQSHVNCVSSVYGIYVSGQLSRDVIGCFKSNRWLSRDVIGCWFIKACCYLL